jgi:hypothetical protein
MMPRPRFFSVSDFAEVPFTGHEMAVEETVRRMFAPQTA